MPSRTEFQQLADIRVAEAAALLAAGLWDGAYYVAGYAVECALKACIAKLTKAEEFPPPRATIEKCYSHDLSKLLDAAGLEKERIADAPVGSQRDAHWKIVFQWNESKRYERTAQVAAELLFEAINDATDGVLPWIRTRW